MNPKNHHDYQRELGAITFEGQFVGMEVVGL